MSSQGLVAAKADLWGDLFKIVDDIFRQAHGDVNHRPLGIATLLRIAGRYHCSPRVRRGNQTESALRRY